MRRLAAAAAAAAVVGLGGTAAAASTMLGDSVPVEQAQDGVVTRTAIIRLGAKVYLHTNATHASVGVRAVSVEGCKVKVTFDGRLPGEKILSATAEEDESVSRLGVQAGFSGNVTTGLISLYRGGRQVCATSRSFGTTSNIWLTVLSYAPGREGHAPAEAAPIEPTSTPAEPTPTEPATTTEAP